MSEGQSRRPAPVERTADAERAESKAPWQPPKLTFVEPTLTKHGGLTQVTGQGFFGTFIP